MTFIMFPGTSTNNDNNTHSGGKISGEIIAIVAVLVTIIILPPFIIAGAVLFKNRRRPKGSAIMLNPTISNPTLDSNSLYHNNKSRAVRHVSLKPVPVLAFSEIFKPLPQLPHARATRSPDLPSTSIPPRSSSLHPPHLEHHPNSRPSFTPRMPQSQLKPLSIPTPASVSIPSLERPNRQAWRTSNPPVHLHNSTGNLTRNNPHDSVVSMISQTSSTYADVDLSDSIPNISPLSPLSSRFHFQSVLHPPTPPPKGHKSTSESSSNSNSKPMDDNAINLNPKTNLNPNLIPRHDYIKKYAPNQDSTSHSKQNKNKNKTETNLHPRTTIDVKKPRESTWELRTLGTKVVRDIRGPGCKSSETKKDKDGCMAKVRFKEGEGEALDAGIDVGVGIGVGIGIATDDIIDTVQVEELYFDFVRK